MNRRIEACVEIAIGDMTVECCANYGGIAVPSCTVPRCEDHFINCKLHGFHPTLFQHACIDVPAVHTLLKAERRLFHVQNPENA